MKLYSDEQLAEVKRRYLANQSVTHIAFALGMGNASVRRILSEQGVKRRKPSRRWVDAGAFPVGRLR